jgi:pyruvate dehydrogenase E2 component (dihydrolipoamide acetyltransferase)
MSIKIEMPRLSDTMQAGTVVKWNVKEGQKVKAGQAIADIETDKATMELPTYEDGTVALVAVPEGQNVPIGTVIMVLAVGSEDPAAIKAQGTGGAASATPNPSRAAQAAGAGASGTPQTSTSSTTALIESSTNGNGHSAGGRIFASPLARKIAAETNINLASLQGTGPAGRIIRKDVEAAVSSGASRGTGVVPAFSAPARAEARGSEARPASLSPASAALVARTIPLSNMRRVIAQRLSESKSTIPHYQVTVDVDMDALLTLRGQLNEQLASQGVKLSVNDFLVRACALAMHKHPYVNARWAAKPASHGQIDPVIEYVADVNVGIAIALPVNEDGSGGGLVVATIRNADQAGLRTISSQSKQLSEKARAKGLSPQEMSDSTFTISNLGMFGVSHFNAIINPPNVAILAVGAALDKPVVRDGKVVPGKVMSMTMSSDHRVVDGAMAAQYLATVKDLLEKPATLLV